MLLFNNNNNEFDMSPFQQPDDQQLTGGGGMPAIRNPVASGGGAGLPKLSAGKRRDHLHLLKRRKSRARFLNQEECAKLASFRKFFANHVNHYQFVHRVYQLRREQLNEVTYDEEGTKISPKQKNVR